MSHVQKNKNVRNRKPRAKPPVSKILPSTPLYQEINAQKAGAYRDSLLPFVGKGPIEFQTSEWEIKYSRVQHKECLTILLQNVQVTKMPPGSDLKTMPVLDHLHIMVDRGWKRRNNPIPGDTLKGTGYAHEYFANSYKRKNVGLYIVELKVKRQNARPQHAHKYASVH